MPDSAENIVFRTEGRYNGLMHITGIHTVICQTTNMDRSVVFYRDVLGLTPGYHSPHWTDFMLGDKKLGLHTPFYEGEGPAVIPFKNAIIGVKTEDIRALRAALEAAGDHVRGDYHDTPGGVILDFVDPDGNNWQAIQVGTRAADLRQN